MNAFIIDQNRLLVPRRAEGPNGLKGDGMVEIGRTDPDFARWERFAVEMPAAYRPSYQDQTEKRHART